MADTDPRDAREVVQPPARPARELRLFGRSIDLLTARLALGVAALVIAPLALGFYALSRLHSERAFSMRQREAELEARILEITLRHQMLEKNTSLMNSVLQEIGSQPEVLSAKILNHHGEVRLSSSHAEVGTRIDRESETCYVCHRQDPEERGRWVRLHEPGGDVLRSVLPIENRRECHECHASEERLNGILILDMSLEELEAQSERDLGWMLLGGAAMAFLLLAGMGWFMRRLVLDRLARLSRTARRIAQGDLEQRAHLAGDDVIAALSDDFDDMAGSIGELVGKLRQQEAQLASVMNSLNDGLVVLDRDSRIIASNHSFCRRVGMHAEGLWGHQCEGATEGRLPCCHDRSRCPAALCVETAEVQRAVFQVPGDDGQVSRVEEVYASPVFGEDGKVVQVVELWRDITERVREEERLAEIERLASLGTLASGFSHEVNTPLASMLLCAESMLGRVDRAAAGDEQQDLLPELRRSAELVRQEVLRCRKITEQFRRFSRGVPPTVEPLDLGEAVRSVVTLAGATAREAGVELRLELERPLPAVRANTEVVQHVLLNLLVNAIQSCEGRTGSVVVSAPDGKDVRVRVEDTGCGIEPEERRHIFEPFRSGKPNGTGLGLFLSRNFMRRFGGDVVLRGSTVGQGSCFEIVFGRQQEDGA